MRKIGLLGGTFDPIHDGHLQLALAAKREIALDTVKLIPAAGPPHKSSESVSSFAHRKEMLLLALAGVDGIEPCFIEGDRPPPSYTIDTVRSLQSADTAGDSDYYFIIGGDAFADLLSWKSYTELLKRVALVVARRRGFTETEKLKAIAQSFGYTQKPGLWRGAGDFRTIYFLKTSPLEISSSQIRDRLAEGCRLVPGVNPAVVDYAQRHKLYMRSG